MTEAEKKPYLVRLTTGETVLGMDSMVEAEASAQDRNQRAEAMGVKARYEAAEYEA